MGPGQDVFLQQRRSNVVMLSYSEIVMAFDFVSSGEEGDNHAWICRDSGEIVYFSEVLGLDERRGQDIHSPNCVAVPHRNDLELGRELVFDFIDEELPDKYASIRDIYADPEDPEGRFRELLQARGVLDRWNDYKAGRIRSSLMTWCQARGIECSGE
ncbi:MAG TPA: hypothetical protein ENN50_06445 [Prosthecochloris aestuarii]|uniref:Uncharacterized protein n=1 Tax=Prosthecochloris aestuarii TaxID=1102 RepID=A0A831SR10_PROAE|nr:hypothetical protein [Prosthecochloris aestuarii]